MERRNSVALIIDDEEDICLLLSNLLRQMEFDVIVSHRLHEGVAQLLLNEPELLFLDLHLPDGSGLEFIRPVKTHFPQTKVIVMSAFDGVEETVAEAAGADVYLRKPLNQQGVFNSIMKINV